MVFKKQQGFVAILATIILVMVMTAVGAGLAGVIVLESKVAVNLLSAEQAYFAAEAGIEDAILRIRKGVNLPGNYSFSLNGCLIEVAVSDPIGGSRTIISQAEKAGITKRIAVVHSLNGDQVEFFFGAQVGDGGIIMDNGSEIEGNVFSNGSVVAGVGTGQTITGDAFTASSGNEIDGINIGGDGRVKTCQNSTIGGDLYVHNCNNSTVQGVLYYVAGGSVINCPASGGQVSLTPGEVDVDPQDLPISLDQINQWKADAALGGVYAGNYVLSGLDQVSLGPKKIEGDLLLQNQAELTLTGTLWVTGNIDLQNLSTLQLSDKKYGFTSGVLIADGIINVTNNVNLKGTGRPGSYIMLLTTSPADPALSVQNSADAGVFYASNGFIQISNNSVLRELTGYGLRLANSVTVQYEVGLANLLFSSGPGSGWQVQSWQEIE